MESTSNQKLVANSIIGSSLVLAVLIYGTPLLNKMNEFKNMSNLFIQYSVFVWNLIRY